MKGFNLRHHPLFFLGLLMVLGIMVLGVLIPEVKKAESLLLTEWSRLRYLAYLLETEASPRKAPLSAEVLKEKLVSEGFKPETIRGSYFGVEVEMELSWRDLARLLSWLSSQDLRVRAFHAEDPSGEGNFRVRMVIR
ncbi:MAG TPA: hypothetical protein ENJ40_09245 [Thermosulfurimonas dismutans]|uniref:Type II secretion system protein M n=1 Tax=Thermosulfurimonas dismutans TaxID=999894 RepID=A0A7C3GIJ0_9BACT|nr:hypothetical protein [Thermosulfurimonas dismutans]